MVKGFKHATSLAGVTLAALLATNASAEPVTLTCSGSATSGLGMALTFDEEARTVAFGQEPVSTATFTGSDISWQVDYTAAGTEIDAAYQLSRTTGAMTRDIIEKGNTNGQQHLTYTCAIARNKF